MPHYLPVATTPRPQAPSLAERAARQVETYWQARITKTLQRLEREARRILRLEEELGTFAMQYHAAVRDALQRLTALEEKLAETDMGATASAQPPLKELSIVLTQCNARTARRRELKARYRHLAKEIHPDRAMIVAHAGTQASHMHTLNAAYQHGDLAALLKLEAEILLNQIAQAEGAKAATTGELDAALREAERAADTYAADYRTLLNSPINALMLRAMNAQRAGWDWTAAVLCRLERIIEEKERTILLAEIALGEWQEMAQAA